MVALNENVWPLEEFAEKQIDRYFDLADKNRKGCLSASEQIELTNLVGKVLRELKEQIPRYDEIYLERQRARRPMLRS